MIASAEYFEMPRDRAIYQYGWTAVTTLANLLWELNTAKPPDVVFAGFFVHKLLRITGAEGLP